MPASQQTVNLGFDSLPAPSHISSTASHSFGLLSTHSLFMHHSSTINQICCLERNTLILRSSALLTHSSAHTKRCNKALPLHVSFWGQEVPLVHSRIRTGLLDKHSEGYKRKLPNFLTDIVYTICCRSW